MELELRSKARAILRKLDAPKRKSDIPTKPALIEMFGTPKAGKDHQLINLDRWFRRMKYQTLVYQEGAESEKQRRAPRDFSYAMQMRYFAQAFDRLLEAAVSRDFHIMFFNRGILDILVWLKFQKRLGKINQEQVELATAFILHGPWVNTIDVVACLTVDTEAALEREYGKNYKSKNVVFGSLMNPQSLRMLKECVDEVCVYLKQTIPNIPLVILDTTHQSEEETRDELISVIVSSLEKRLEVSEDDVLPWSIDLMKEKAWLSGPEIKLKGVRPHEFLRSHGWQFETGTRETDTCLSPNGSELLDTEFLHIRKTGSGCYLVFKRDDNRSLNRYKIPIPIPEDCVKELLETFTPMGTVEKDREIFTKPGFILHRDNVTGLGQFTEIKGFMSTSEADLMREVNALGFSESDIAGRSYLRLKLQQGKS